MLVSCSDSRLLLGIARIFTEHILPNRTSRYLCESKNAQVLQVRCPLERGHGSAKILKYNCDIASGLRIIPSFALPPSLRPSLLLSPLLCRPFPLLSPYTNSSANGRVRNPSVSPPTTNRIETKPLRHVAWSLVPPTHLQHRSSVRNLAPSSAPAFGASGGNPGGDQDGGACEEGGKEGEEEEEDSDEEPDAPPLQRGIVSSQGISHGGSSSGGGGSFSTTAGNVEEEAGPRWEPNMQLSLAEFDQDSVTYLAEVFAPLLCRRGLKNGVG